MRPMIRRGDGWGDVDYGGAGGDGDSDESVWTGEGVKGHRCQ